MSKANQNIDETFRNAFQDWEADYSMQEMNADWDAFSKNIPQPQQPQAPQKPMVKSPLTNPWSATKILGLSSAAGLIITAATILINTSDDKEINKLSQNSPETGNLPKTEQLAEEKQINTAPENTINHDLKDNSSNKEAGKKQNTSKQSEKINKSRPAASGVTGKTAIKEDILLFENNNNRQPKQDKTENNVAQVTVKQENRIITLNDTNICQSAAIRIYNNTNNKESKAGMRINWGDGKVIKTSQATAIYTYEKVGSYELTVEGNNETITRVVNVKAKPEAHFTNYQCIGLTCKFRNTSKNAYGYEWYFGDNNQPQSGFHAEYSFPDTGRYPVKLVAFSQSGCTDTLVQWVKVSNKNNFTISQNFLTPNNDGRNDAFTIDIDNTEYFELIIMNRAGQIVFRSHDKNNSWDGISQQDGSPCPAGTYFYSLSYQLPGENVNRLAGNVTLIR